MANRQIVLDTETTGLEPKEGHRIIELAGVELVNRRLTGRHFHRYLNPEREIEVSASEVHGFTWEDLRDKPKFCDVIQEFLSFIEGAELIIHNAPFDLAFLDYELSLLGEKTIQTFCVEITDTLKLAKDLHPGKRASLDVLCERYQIDNTGRKLHGALMDAQLLAEVFLAMTRGQETLVIDMVMPAAAHIGTAYKDWPPLKLIIPTLEELALHNTYLEELERETKGNCVWRRIEETKEKISVTL